MKNLIVLCCLLSLMGCSTSRMPELDPVATAEAPWEPGETIVRGFCSRAATGWCIRMFHGVTADHKILVQDFWTVPAARREVGVVHDPYTGIVDEKFTDPYTVLTVEDAEMNLFYVDNGKDGEYRKYDEGVVIERGAFRNGLKEGRWYYRLPMGETEEGSYVAGEKHGTWVFRNRWWSPRIEEKYDHGQRVYDD